MTGSSSPVDAAWQPADGQMGVVLARPSGFDLYERPELVDLVPRNAKDILEVGCGTGALGAVLKRRQPCLVAGIELDSRAGAIASRCLDEVVMGDVEKIELPWLPNSFDVVVLAEVLDHLVDPWTVVRTLRPMLRDGGALIATTPNSASLRAIYALMNGGWIGYTGKPAFARDHLHIFTRSVLEELLRDAGFLQVLRGSIMSPDLTLPPADPSQTNANVEIPLGPSSICLPRAELAERLVSEIVCVAVKEPGRDPKPASSQLRPAMALSPMVDDMDSKLFLNAALDYESLRHREPALAPMRESLSEHVEALRPEYERYVSTVSTASMAASLETTAYLRWLCDTLQPTRLVDLGSGFSSYVLRDYQRRALANGMTGVEVVSVDDAPEWLDKTREFLSEHEVSADHVESWDEFQGAAHEPFDLVFHDLGGGDVREAALPTVLSSVRPGGVAVLDDADHQGHRDAMTKAAADARFDLYSLRYFTLDSIDRFALLAVSPTGIEWTASTLA